MLSQQDLDLSKERVARQPVKGLINFVRNSVMSEEPKEKSQIIDFVKKIARENNLSDALIIWSEIRKENNQKYPQQEGIVEGLDALGNIDDIVAEAGIQLKDNK